MFKKLCLTCFFVVNVGMANVSLAREYGEVMLIHSGHRSTRHDSECMVRFRKEVNGELSDWIRIPDSSQSDYVPFACELLKSAYENSFRVGYDTKPDPVPGVYQLFVNVCLADRMDC